MEKFAEKLKIGDKVIVSKSVYGTHTKHVTKIARITKTLFITESGYRFSKKFLLTPGETWNFSSLKEWTPETEEQIRKEKILFLLKNNVQLKINKIILKNASMTRLNNLNKALDIFNLKEKI